MTPTITAMQKLRASHRFEDAVARFDAANALDPNHASIDGIPQPKELVYARRMTMLLAHFAPDASEGGATSRPVPAYPALESWQRPLEVLSLLFNLRPFDTTFNRGHKFVQPLKNIRIVLAVLPTL